MPRTASTTKTDRIAPRASTKFREERVTDQVPVLFRLPLVECLPVPSVAGEPMFATAESQPEWTPTPVVAPPPPIQPIQPPQPKPATPVVSSSTKEVEPVYVQAVAAIQPFAAASHPSLKIDTDSERSWWEHWSSGVVLILLIIALVTASILAFNDTGSTDPSLLAELGDKTIETLDLTIPELTPPQVTTPGVAMQTQQAASPANDGILPGANRPSHAVPANDGAASTSSLIPSDLEFESQAVGIQSSVAISQPTTAAPVEANPSQPTLRPLATLVDRPTGSLAATQEAPAGAALLAPNAAATLTTSPMASASLSPPTSRELPPLFPNDELSSGDVPATSQTLSGSSSTGSSTAAQAPALTDGALTLPSGLLEQPSQPSVGANTSLGTNSLIETDLPSYQAMLIGTSASPSGSQFSLIPSENTIPSENMIPNESTLPAAPAASTLTAPTATGVPATETPELSTEAIIRAWQMHKAVNQAQTTPSNRYVAPDATNPGGTMSYTLGGATSTVNPSLPGSSSTGTTPANSTLPRF